MEKETNLAPYIEKLNRKTDLSAQESAQAMRLIMSTEIADSPKAAFLIALQAKGASQEEIASFAALIREMACQIDISGLSKDKVLMDTCGTGAGGVETFNISTTVMFILAAAGIAVAKHGNRAITSKCGSADVLQELGINILLSPQQASRCLCEINITFLFAPLCHGAFKHVQPIRRQIPAPTVFNILGPLVNPVFSLAYKQGIRTAQILGTNNEDLTAVLIGVLKILNLNRAMVVYGEGLAANSGMDEISTLGDTRVCELSEDGQIKDYRINPDTFGIKRAMPEDLKGGTPPENARILRDILSAKLNGPKRDIVLINAAAGLYLGGKAASLQEGLSLAAQCIDSKSALKKLEQLRRLSNQASI